MIEPSKIPIEQVKTNSLYVDIKPMVCVLALFFLAAGALSVQQSFVLDLGLKENLMIFSFLLGLAFLFGYFTLREGLKCQRHHQR